MEAAALRRNAGPSIGARNDSAKKLGEGAAITARTLLSTRLCRPFLHATWLE
jgi:hypothetical protein